MKKTTAMFAALALSFALATPAHAQMFRQAMTDSVYEQNIPNFRQMGLMASTGMDVNLDVVSDLAFEMATGNGSLATLPEAFRSADAYKLKFRTVNGLTARTMPLDQFRALVNGQGIRLLRPADFAAAPAAPIVVAPTPVVAAAPATVVQPTVVRVATPADTARISGLENRITAIQAAQSQGRVTPAQLAELQALRTELNQIKTDIGSLTTAVSGQEGRLTTVEGIARGAATVDSVNAALATKANKDDVGISAWGWFAIIAALLLSLIGIAAYGRTVRLGKRVTTLEEDSSDATTHQRGVHIPAELEDYLTKLNVGESYEFPITIDGEKLLVRFTVSQKGALKRTMVTTDDIDRQTQPMRVDTLRSKLLGHIGAGRLSATSVQQKQTALKAAA